MGWLVAEPGSLRGGRSLGLVQGRLQQLPARWLDRKLHRAATGAGLNQDKVDAPGGVQVSGDDDTAPIRSRLAAADADQPQGLVAVHRQKVRRGPIRLGSSWRGVGQSSLGQALLVSRVVV
jgi:hypothetical protein